MKQCTGRKWIFFIDLKEEKKYFHSIVNIFPPPFDVYCINIWNSKLLHTSASEVIIFLIIILKLMQIFLYFLETPSLYENNHYHEECLKCNSCGMNLSGPNQKRARRFKNQILCDLHFADMALMESSDFMQQLRNFKPQSLGCAVARRKSSTTLIFPLPPQACSGIILCFFKKEFSPSIHFKNNLNLS